MVKKSILNNTVLDKFKSAIVSTLGYMPLTKSEYKATALNMATGRQSAMSVENKGLRKPSKVSFKMLRQIASRDAIIRICVNTIKKEVSQAEWSIRFRKNTPKKVQKEMENSRLELEDIMYFMNTNGETMRILLDRVLEDLLTLDAGAIEVVRNLDGTLKGLNAVDVKVV